MGDWQDQTLITANSVYQAISLAVDRSARHPLSDDYPIKSSVFALGKRLDLVRSLSEGPVLFVGEGNLSLSLAVARTPSIRPNNLTATTFESEGNVSAEGRRNASALRQRGATVRHGVDATNLDKYFPRHAFQTIFFGFPNVASRLAVYGHNPNHNLARRFLRSASGRLASGGKIIITLVASSYYDGAFNLPAAARFAGLGQPKIFDFDPKRIAGYAHANTLGNGSALRKYRHFRAWVFRT